MLKRVKHGDDNVVAVFMSVAILVTISQNMCSTGIGTLHGQLCEKLSTEAVLK